MRTPDHMMVVYGDMRRKVLSLYGEPLELLSLHLSEVIESMHAVAGEVTVRIWEGGW